MVNGRRKGANDERGVSHGYTAGGIEARRGCQYSAVGNDGSVHPDVIFLDEDVDLYCECKARKTGPSYLFDWVAQAREEAPGDTTAIVTFKINHRPRVAVMDFTDHVKREKILRDLRRENQAFRAAGENSLSEPIYKSEKTAK